MSNKRLNSEIILDKTEIFLASGELESLSKELYLLKRAVAFLSNQLEIDQQELEDSILYGYKLRSRDNE